MPERCEKRLVISLPVRVYGIGSDGKAFNQDAITVDVTRDGAQIKGVQQIRSSGEIVGVQYADEKARFKVVWVGEAGSERAGRIGVQAIEREKCPWSRVLDGAPEQFRWTEIGLDRDRSSRPVAPAAAKTPTFEEITARVERSTRELKEIEVLIESGAVEPRILQEFREAVNHVRRTSWAVQKWIELKGKQEDPYSAMQILLGERIRCATQLNRDLGSDIEGHDISFETQGLSDLRVVIDQLSHQLDRLSRKPIS